MAIRRSGFFLLAVSFRKFAGRTAIELAIVVLAIPVLFAQQTPPTTQQDGTAQSAPPGLAQAAVTVPAGTRLALVLTHPVDSKSTHRGDEIYAQITAPVAVAGHAVIPAGTFAQGPVERLVRRGSQGEIVMQSLALVFPNGYVARVAGPLDITSEEGTAWRDPGGGAKTAAFIAPAAGLGLGALIGSAAHTTQTSSLGGMTLTSRTPSGLAIGSLVGLAAGGAVALLLLVRSPHFYVDVGSTMQASLPQPLSLPAEQVEKSGAAQAPAPLVAPPSPRPVIVPGNTGICQTPGTPGTPPTVIPGTPPTVIPGTPPTVVPGTPDVVIPGTPATPGSTYPCSQP